MATAVPAAAVSEEGAVGHGGRTHVTVVALHAFEDRARDRRPIRKVAAIIVCERTRSDWRSNTFLTVLNTEGQPEGVWAAQAGGGSLTFLEAAAADRHLIAHIFPRRDAVRAARVGREDLADLNVLVSLLVVDGEGECCRAGVVGHGRVERDVECVRSADLPACATPPSNWPSKAQHVRG